MIQALIPFITAIALSGIAAFYSVIGLAQIFPGSFWPIIIMGSILEISKLVTVSWLYDNWEKTNRLMKSYFLTAIVLLMLITSMGIFGFLSRAHIESNVVSGSNSVQLQVLDTQEKIARERLDYLLMRAQDPSRVTNRLDREIKTVQEELTRISKEKLPLLAEQNKLTAEIGPIKYIAELLYTKDDPDFIDKAVRVVILIIIIVFDPLAVILLIAANQTYKKYKTEQKKIHKTVDKPIKNDVKYSINDTNEIIPKSKITKFIDGDFK